jgi:hypothetical protein
MNDFRDNMFVVPFLHIEVRNWNLKKKQLKDLYYSSQIIHSADKNEHVKTNYHTLDLETSSFKTYLNNIFNILSEEIGYFKSYFEFDNCYMKSAWFEQALQYDFHEVHNHGTFGYSSVCFIDYNSEIHTPTKFLSPFDHFITGEHMLYTPSVNEGSLIFFPSAIKHFTNPNVSEQERIILSFNLELS